LWFQYRTELSLRRELNHCTGLTALSPTVDLRREITCLNLAPTFTQATPFTPERRFSAYVALITQDRFPTTNFTCSTNHQLQMDTQLEQASSIATMACNPVTKKWLDNLPPNDTMFLPASAKPVQTAEIYHGWLRWLREEASLLLAHLDHVESRYRRIGLQCTYIR